MSRLWDKGDAAEGPVAARLAAFTVGDDPVTDLSWAAEDVRGSVAWVAAQEHYASRNQSAAQYAIKLLYASTKTREIFRANC